MEPPTDTDQKNLIDKVAQYVAKNGTEFEQMMRTKQQGNMEYDFLRPGGRYNGYYEGKVKTERIAWKFTAQREAAAQAARELVAKSHTQWHEQTQQTQQQQQQQQQPKVNKWNPTLNQKPSFGVQPGQSSSRFTSGFGTAAPSNAGPQSGGWKAEDAERPPISKKELEELHNAYNKKKNEYESNIRESDSNLKEQRKSLMTDKENRVDEVIEKKLITDCSKEAIKVDINLDEFHKILRPIVKYCTKESIATGKAWILKSGGRDLKSARLICKYISARVLSTSASFEMRLHTIYLINDVLYHANSRDNRTIMTAFEEIIVPLWSITKLRADKEIGERLLKLKKLWSDNKYFSNEIEERFNMHIVEYKQFRDELRSKYSKEVTQAEEEFDSQFKGFEKQHAEYIKHTEKILAEEKSRINDKEKEYAAWETKMAKLREKDEAEMRRNQEGLEKYKKQLNLRAQCNSQGQNTNFGPMGKQWNGDETGLIPDRKYYDLPAGLMAAVVTVETKKYTPIDPDQLRLVPHIQPSQKLLEALDEFYRPLPPNVQMRNGWPNGALDDFFMAKTAALNDSDDTSSNSSSRKRSSNSSSDHHGEKPIRKSRFSSVKSH